MLYLTEEYSALFEIVLDLLSSLSGGSDIVASTLLYLFYENSTNIPASLCISYQLLKIFNYNE